MKTYKYKSVSTIAILAALASGPALAQSQDFQNGGTYVGGGTGWANGSWSAINEAAASSGVISNSPGLDAATSPRILLDGYGNVVLSSTTGTVNPDGTPVKTTYSQENHSASDGAGPNAGNVLVDATGHLVSCGAICGGGAVPAGTSWVAVTSQDNNLSYHWSNPTYAQETAASTAYVASATNGTAGNYLIDASGKIVSASAAAAAGITATSNAAAVANAGFTLVNPSNPDPKVTTAQLPATDTLYNRVVNGRYSQATNAAGVTNSTTSAPGGAVYKSANGATSNTTGIGPNGLSVKDSSGKASGVTATAVGVTDGKGNLTGVTATGLGVTDGTNATTVTATGVQTTGQLKATSATGATTTVTGDGFTFDDGKGGKVEIHDPVVAVSGASGKTEVKDGSVIVNSTGGGNTTIQGGTVTTSGNVVAGGNIIAQGQVQASSAKITGHTETQTLSVTDTLAAHTAYTDNLYVGTTNVGATLTDLSSWRTTVNQKLKDLEGGIAVAAALNVPHVDPGRTMALNVSAADYGGSAAVGAVAAFRFSGDIQGFVGAGWAPDGGPALIKGGATFQFGGSPYK